MTHPTDEELDALVQRLHGTPLYEGHGEASETPERAADAIATIRAQLAEAKADKEKLGRELNLARYGQPDFSWQVHKEALAEANARADRANARADRAEAALADADAMIEAQAKDHAENNIRLAEMAHRVSQLEGMVVSGQGEKIRLAADLLQAKIECNEANARADRAEPALAAQIEADALVCDELAAACAMALALAANDTPEVRTAVAYSIKIAKRCAATIRNQPHDRSALDRMLAEAEARGYEIAKAEAARAGWHLRRYDLAKRDAELAHAQP